MPVRMPLRHWLRSATPRTTLVCLQPTAGTTRRPAVPHKRFISSPPAANSISLPILSGAQASLKQTWSWLFPESEATACECPSHAPPRKKDSKGMYSHHRERLHQALVDHFHEIEQLYRGNLEFVRRMGEHSPGLLEDLAFEGQSEFSYPSVLSELVVHSFS